MVLETAAGSHRVRDYLSGDHDRRRDFCSSGPLSASSSCDLADHNHIPGQQALAGIRV